MDFLFDILSDEDRGFYREAGLKLSATPEEVADLILRTDLAPDTKWAKSNPIARNILVALLEKLAVEVPSSKWMWRWIIATEKKVLTNSGWTSRWEAVPGEEIEDFMHLRGGWTISAARLIGQWMPTLKEHNVKITLSEYSDIQELRDALEETIEEIEIRDRAQDVVWDGSVVHKFKNGWYVLQLGSTDDMEFEGKFMNNCIGSGDHNHPQALEEDLASYFSLRDPNGVPHVSIAVDNSDSEIIEIQGRSNSTPKPEYLAMIKDFVDQSWVNYSAYPSTGHLRDVPEVRVEPEHNPDWDEWRDGETFYVNRTYDLYQFKQLWSGGEFYASEEAFTTEYEGDYYYYIYQQATEVLVDVDSVLEEIQEDFSPDDDTAEIVDQAQLLFVAMALESIQSENNIFDIETIEEISPIVGSFFRAWFPYLDDLHWRSNFPDSLQDFGRYGAGVPWPDLPDPPPFTVISKRADTVKVVLDGAEWELEILERYIPDRSVGLGGSHGLILFDPTPSLFDVDADESILFLEDDGTLYRGEEVVGFKSDERRRRRSSQTNWETWNVKLMMDNDENLWEESREIAQSGTIEDLRDWAIVNIIAPHNVEAIESAKEWNSMPSDERIDPLFEDLKEKSPAAADIVDQLGFGPDIEDETPRIIDPELVNWDEIFEDIQGEFDENLQYEQEMKRLEDMGLAWRTNHDDNVNIMRDAFYRFYGANPDAGINDPDAYHNIYVHISGEDVMNGATQYSWPRGYLTPETEHKIWEIGRSHPESLESPEIQKLIKADSRILEIMKNGLDVDLSELTWELIRDIRQSKSNPFIPVMVEALKARGYSDEDIDQLMKPIGRWDGGTYIVLNPTEKEEVDLDSPSDFHFPKEWLGSTSCPDLGPVLQEFVVDSPFVKVAQDEDLPHYPDVVYGWKILNVEEDGTLVSPHQGTPWPSGKYLEANEVPDKEQGGFNVPGIHAVMDEKMGLLIPYVYDTGALVKIAMVGKIVEHDQGYRCQFAYPSEIYLRSLDMANLVRAKYPGVEVSLMEESQADSIGLVSVIRDVDGNELYRSTSMISEKKLIEEAVERGADLSRANLEGANLKGANLGGTSLQGANLKGAYLFGANLEGADLEGANLKRANLEGANLGRANLRWASLQSALLGGANLEGADLYKVNLRGAYLSGANLSGANLEGTDLRGANLYLADLRGAHLEGANLYRATLGGANLQGANLSGADLRGASLRGADLQGANLSGADLGGANLSGANLSGANLGGADLSGANLWEASLRGTDLRGANLSRANLWGANLIQANLMEASLMETDLRWANLQGANLKGANLEGANLEEANLEGAIGFQSKTTSVHPISILYLDGQLYFGPTYAAIANQIRPKGEEWRLWQDGLWGQILAGEENQVRWDSTFSPKHLIAEAMVALKKEYRDVKLWERDAALVKQFGVSDGIIDDYVQEKVATPRQEGSLPQDNAEAQEALPQTAGQIEHIWPDSDDILEAYYAVIEASGDEDLGFRDFGLLEGALGATQMAYQYGAYGDIFDLAADLINKLQRQQAIVNANKRTSSAVGFQFLEDNGWETGGISDDETLEDEFIRLVYGLSDSTEEERTTIEELAAFLRGVCTPGADQSISPVETRVADTFQTGPSQLRRYQLHDPFILLGGEVYFGSDYSRLDLSDTYSYHGDLLGSLQDSGILVEDLTNGFFYRPIPEIFGWVYRDKGTPRDTGDAIAYGFDSDFALDLTVRDNDLIHAAVKAKYPNAKFISEPVQKTTALRRTANVKRVDVDGDVPLHPGWEWRQPLIYDEDASIIYVGPPGSHHFDLLEELQNQGIDEIKSPDFGMINLTTGEWLTFFVHPKRVLDEIDEVLPGFFYTPPRHEQYSNILSPSV